MHKTLISMFGAALLAIMPMTAFSIPITLTLSDAAVDVTYGGVARTVDLMVVAQADTVNFSTAVANGTSEGYGNLLLRYTSAALGLSGVLGSELWEFTWRFGSFNQDSVILVDAGEFDGAGAIGFGGAISSWDGITSLGPVGPADGSVVNAPGDPTDTIGGIAFVLRSWGSGATFSAVTGATPVPEPATLWLLAGGLIAVGLLRAKRRRA
jgi:hypothetical protein